MRVGVFGAGAVGGYLGVRLSASGTPVTLVARPELAAARSQLRAIALDRTESAPAADLVVTDEPAALSECDVCLVTVKSADTASAAEALTRVLPRDAIVVSFQNGLRNVPALSRALEQPAIAGMVTFNVRREGTATFRRTTSGPLLAGTGAGPAAARMRELAAAFERAGEPLGLRRDIDAVLVGKLLLNLNNGLCTITGLSIADSLRSRELRWCFAACLREGLDVVHAAGLRETRIGPLSPALVARLLAVPDFVFFRLARSMLAIDPAARSSTLQDLDRGRPTEIDSLNGEIVRLAQERGIPAPANAYVVEQVHRLERAARPRPFVPPSEAKRAIGAALAQPFTR